MYLFQPLVLLGLTAGEAMLGVAVHEIDLRRPGSCNLLLGDSVGPKPIQIH